MTIEYCDHCGGHAAGDHARCRAARELEPPRYCGQCGRRMIVQVTPDGWTGRCARHGVIAAATVNPGIP
jgi:hypothetical protein